MIIKKQPYEYCQMKEKYTCEIISSFEAGNSYFHMHNNYEIFLLLRGNINYFVEQTCYSMQAGDLILVNDNEIHKAINLSNQVFDRLVIHINPDMIRQYCTPQTNLFSCFHIGQEQENYIQLETKEVSKLIDYGTRLSDLINTTDLSDYGQDIAADLLMLEILLLVNKIYMQKHSTNKISTPNRVLGIMNYVDEHLTETLSLDSIATAMSLDKYYISHLFKAETQSSVFQYILVKRISLAKEMLAKGHTVTETCQLAGFNDYSNFIRSFRKITGFTPGQYRKSFH